MKITDEAVQAAIEGYNKTSRIKLQEKELMGNALSAALPYLQTGYKVKQLKWVDATGVSEATEFDRLMRYFAVHVHNGKGDYSWALEFNGEFFRQSKTLDEAKALAQADFERRVRECIEDARQELEDTCNVTDPCCPHCGGSGHIDDVVTKPIDVEVRASAKNIDGVISEYAGAAFKQQGNGVPELIWHAHFREFASAIRALSAEPAQPVHSEQRLPIETAPKDGTEFLGFDIKGRICIYKYEPQKHHKYPRPYFSSRTGWRIGVTWDRDHQPIHWMPLPAAPTTEAGQ